LAHRGGLAHPATEKLWQPPICRHHGVLFVSEAPSCDCRSGLWPRNDSESRKKIVGPGNLYVTGRQAAWSPFDWCDRHARRFPLKIVDQRARPPRRYCRRSGCAGGARSRKPRDFHHHQTRSRQAVVAETSFRAAEQSGCTRVSFRATALSSLPARTKEICVTSPTMLAPEHLTVDSRARSRLGRSTPARSSLAAGHRRPWAITSPAPITLCRLAAWRCVRGAV